MHRVTTLAGKAWKHSESDAILSDRGFPIDFERSAIGELLPAITYSLGHLFQLP